MDVTFHVGTSGWHYKHWRNDFYPPKLPTARWLEYYVRQFDTVELNASFYRQPKPHAWDLWREVAPPGFLFAVKSSRYITHIKRLAVEPGSLDLLFSGIRRLGEHAGPVLYQFPATFRRDEHTFAALERFLPMLPADYTHVFEFRDASWFDGVTYELLDAHGAAFCSLDMLGIEAPLRLTGDTFYMRFHGSGARYGGNYEDTALRAWAARLREVAAPARQAFIYFNNDIGGHAPRNAATLRSFLV